MEGARSPLSPRMSPGSPPILPSRPTAGAGVRLAEAAAAAPVRLAKSLTSQVWRTVSLHREKCKAMLLDTTFQVRHQVLMNFRDLIKGAFTEDPYIPVCLAKNISVIIDVLWNDIEDEIERDIEAALLTQQANAEVGGPQSTWFVAAGYLRVRAFVLFHYLPYNKSIWGKIRDPVYLVVFFAMLVPLSVLHFGLCLGLLLMLLFPGPPDEFQLLNFIMLFKGLQFVSGGVIKCFKCAMVEFACYSLEPGHLFNCINSFGPPSTSPIDLLLDYMGTVVLTWIAASMLGRSKTFCAKRNEDSLFPAGRRRRGGRVWHLLKYDVVCFLISVALLMLLTLSMCERISMRALANDAKFSNNIFWCSVFWSLSTLPFLPLNVSFLFTAMSRSTPTGFNHLGACVPWEVSFEKDTGKPSEGVVDGIAKGIRRLQDIGAEKRNRTPSVAAATGYAEAVGDLTLGLYETVKNTTFDSNAHQGVVVDMVNSAEHMVLVWDRY